LGWNPNALQSMSKCKGHVGKSGPKKKKRKMRGGDGPETSNEKNSISRKGFQNCRYAGGSQMGGWNENEPMARD